MNFQIIYGAIPDKYRGLEFTDKIQNYIDTLWKEYKKNGYVENPDSHKRFTIELPEMKATKLMNYMVQSLETSRNIKVLWQVLQFLHKHSYKSKILLVTYDAFTVDWNEEDGLEVLTGIKEIMERGGYPVKVKRSKDLNF